MRLVRYNLSKSSTERLGIQLEDGILEMDRLADHLNCPIPLTMRKLLKDHDKGIEQLMAVLDRAKELHFDMSQYLLSESDFRYLPVIGDPEKILCVGLNYVDHVKATGADVPVNPVFFNKFPNALAAHKQVIPLPVISQKVDYEAELVIMIGDYANSVSESEAKKAVLGYTVGNDISERQYQFQSSQWMIGKTFDFFGPVGPALVTKDEIEDVNNLSIHTKRNNELVQNSSTSNMIFSVERIVSEASQYMTLKPGDLIFTGTPSGVIVEQKDPNWLKSEEVVEITIEHIGTLCNQMI
ncbi:fumarylacetoacetate hydrolase family protein [Alkalibacterium thalassium]|uniref:2-keto-4-pentenoate hydratase/2-oxohepta-3-ene-1,7-dioic acid hydratase (Catechol pathway) n=1 Tax=Alkalibacterium thalassium TaxID=426701 RepID=A0A1G9G3C7_9LACT|nr:fumarylacetoacetate hydrolase family protein [Alkalibacterium thalassium]SDK95178.1 2-keto-4-pentenoate hydratase/2-oxohepta-3-ene-1,7-dioic acid hydratase (catechol pathway) [Alkalibacterium thalassium]